MTWRAQVLTSVETEAGPHLRAVTRFVQPGTVRSFPGEGAFLGFPRPATTVLVSESFPGPGFEPPKIGPAAGRGPRGPAHSGRGSEPRGAGAGAGSAAAPLRSRAAVTRARSPGAAAAGSPGRLPGSAEHLAGGLWPGPALGPGRRTGLLEPDRAQPPCSR